MKRRDIGSLWLLLGSLACADTTAPSTVSIGDIFALQVTARFTQQAYSVDSSAYFAFTVRNTLPRPVVIYGAGCLVTLELENLKGTIVFPTGAQPCFPPLETFPVGARDSVFGTVGVWGARGDPSTIGMSAFPAGSFRMRVVIQGVSDTRTYNPVRVQSAWSDVFTVSP